MLKGAMLKLEHELHEVSVRPGEHLMVDGRRVMKGETMIAELLIKLLTAEQKHAEFVARTWRKKPPDGEDAKGTEAEISFKDGYACGLLHAVNLIQKYLVGESE